jgi:Na+-transporting methylmalonyl-CoA/oxaloacetate decarboxylase beta subunit
MQGFYANIWLFLLLRVMLLIHAVSLRGGIIVSIGIIGGSDGPTTIVISSSVDWVWIVGAAVIIAGGIISFVLIRRRKKKDRK